MDTNAPDHPASYRIASAAALTPIMAAVFVAFLFIGMAASGCLEGWKQTPCLGCRGRSAKSA
jgi:hypothetical protein